VASAWSYEGMRVIVSGGSGGVGTAVVQELGDLGAEVHVLDIQEPSVDVASYQVTDLRDPWAVATAVDRIGGRIDALFNCAGVPGGPDLDVMLTNFVGVRHLAELVVHHMASGGAIASVSSTAGRHWERNVDTWMALVRCEGFEAAKAWCEAHPDDIAGGYSPSKEALIVWTMFAAVGLASQGIRINCISPGPTDTPMLPVDFPQALIECIPLGRRARPSEQADPLIYLNSRGASYVTGQNLVTDGGTIGGVSTGQIDLDKILAAALG
jgi:NAD(P)-dependent dehydrogenase (short-subunit alcohol dehydrogenase family)